MKYVQKHLQGYFPTLPSYNRFIELMSEILIPLTAFMQSRCHQGNGIAFVDSTPLRVCQNLRIPRHKTFKEVAGRSKSSKLNAILYPPSLITYTPFTYESRTPIFYVTF